MWKKYFYLLLADSKLALVPRELLQSFGRPLANMKTISPRSYHSLSQLHVLKQSSPISAAPSACEDMYPEVQQQLWVLESEGYHNNNRTAVEAADGAADGAADTRVILTDTII